jgi:hypothetical protein
MIKYFNTIFNRVSSSRPYVDGSITGYLMTPYQLQWLFKVEWSDRVIVFKECEITEEEAAVAYFRIASRHSREITKEMYIKLSQDIRCPDQSYK